MRHPSLTLLVLAPLALAIGATATTLTRVTASPDIFVDLAPPLVADHAVAVQMVGGGAGLLDLGVLPEAVELTAYHQENSLSHLFAVDLSVDLDGLLVEPRDVVRVDLSGPSPAYSLAFDGSTRGVPDGAKIDAVTRSSNRVAVSFDVHVAGFGPEDLLVPASGGFAALFDGSAAGVPDGMDLDGAYLLESTGRLFLSFDTGGEIDGFVIADDDVIEWDLVLARWIGVPWRGSLEDPGWSAADLDALAIVPYDTRLPTNPTLLRSTSHPVSAWSTSSVIDFEWQGAADDSSGSGLDGYSRLVDHRRTGLPDEAIEQGHDRDPNLFSTGLLSDGDDWYFHLRTCDQAGNCAAAVHRGPYWIDSRAPSPASDLHSTSHLVGELSSDPTVEMAWTAAVDVTSGLAGYGVSFRTSSAPSCHQIIQLGAGETSYIGSPLADGQWFFHLCAVDVAGNWGTAVVAGPYDIDATPPTVVLAHSVADTGDGALADGEVTRQPLSQLSLRFSEAVENPAGHTEPGDVSNPDSYRIVDAGPDGLLQTADCLGAQDDDLERIIAFVDFGDPAETANLYVSAPDLLPAGAYRLIGCAPGGVHDAAGNALDGDGDGSGGDPFQLDFRIAAEHKTIAPTLDEELAEWTVSGSGVQWDSEDSGGWPTSGSAWIFESAEANQGISQCVAVSAGAFYRLRAQAMVWSGTSTAPWVWAEAEAYASTDCSSGPLGLTATSAIVGFDIGLRWQTLSRWVEMPAGALSARVRFLVDEGSATSYDVFYDDLQLRDPGAFFADDFESGDTTAWSGSAP